VSGEYHAGADAAEGALDDLVLEILRVVIDDHDFRVEGDVRRFRLVKRARTLA
jgi:hypothetical protein